MRKAVIKTPSENFAIFSIVTEKKKGGGGNKHGDYGDWYNELKVVVLIFDLSFVLCARIGIVLDKSETRLTFSELAWTNSILSV